MGEPKNTMSNFWTKVDKNGPVPEHMPHLGPCWIWALSRGAGRYAELRMSGKSYRAHRIAWQITNGPIPAEKPCVLHHCDNVRCVRPDHLWLGTRTDNNRDKMQTGRHVATPGDKNGSRRHPERRARGERVNTCKLTESQVREIRRRWPSDTSRELAEAFGVDRTTIWNTATRRTWKHVA